MNQHTVEARCRATEWVANLENHLNDAGVGQISEIFDGDSPHAPRGCIAQAWSVAELLRTAVEDIHGVLPAAPVSLSS